MYLDVLVNLSLQTVVSACAEMQDAWSGAKLVKREAVSRSWPDVQGNALLDFLFWGNVFFTPSDAALFQWMNEMNGGRVWLRQLETCFLFILEEEDFQHQKAQKKFWAPGENRTHDPPSPSLDVIPWTEKAAGPKKLGFCRQTARWKSNMFHKSI